MASTPICSFIPEVFPRIKQCGIQHKLIKPYTPRHNGKVERSHRKDNEYFYATHSFYSFDDFKQQLSVHNRNYNNFPMRPLNWKSPADYLKAFLINCEVFWFCNTSLTNLHLRQAKNSCSPRLLKNSAKPTCATFKINQTKPWESAIWNRAA